MPIFPKNAVVRVTEDYKKVLQDEIDNKRVAKPEYYKEFLASHHFVFLGEVERRAGTGIFASYGGKVYWPFLVTCFELVPDEEL